MRIVKKFIELEKNVNNNFYATDFMNNRLPKLNLVNEKLKQKPTISQTLLNQADNNSKMHKRY